MRQDRDDNRQVVQHESRWPTAPPQFGCRSLPKGDGRKWVKLCDGCSDTGIDAVLTTGGTELTGRDVTVEAHPDACEREIETVDTVFPIVSMQKIDTSAVPLRACAAV